VATGPSGRRRALKDSSGVTTAAAVSFTDGRTALPPARPNLSRRRNSHQGIINGTTGTTPTVTITGIPAAYTTYDLIVYTLDDAARIERITVGSTSFHGQLARGNAAGYQDSNAGTAYTYLQGTTNSATPAGGTDYVRFTGLTGSSVSFTADARIATFPTNGNDNAFVNASRSCRHPSQRPLGLLALGGIAPLVRRRHRRA